MDDDNKPCGLVSIVDLFYFFLKGDFSAAAPHVSAPVSVRERPSMSQSYITPLFSPGISASGSMNDMSVGDFCMNLPETIVQPRISNVNREEMDADTYDEDFERMKGNVRRENEFRERNDIGGGMGERFFTKKRIIE